MGPDATGPLGAMTAPSAGQMPSGRPRPYTALVEATPVGPLSTARAAGRISDEEQARLRTTGARVPAPAPTAVTVPWYGGHVVMGRPR